MKKPPDKYRTMKCSLNDIIKNKSIKIKLFDIVIRTNKIVIQTYQFLRLWILSKYHNNHKIPIVTTSLIKTIFKCLIKESRGPKSKNILFNELKLFYENEYSKLNNNEKLDGSKLSQILNYTSTTILTSIENNIKQNFLLYVNRFVNSSFKKENDVIIDKTNKKLRYNVRKQLNKELYEIKQDLLNNTSTSNIKYHVWINKHRNNIFPINFKILELYKNPQQYIKSMIYMCLEIEKNETKLFQFLPLRNDIIPKFVPIDTKSIVEVLLKNNKSKYLKDIESNKEYLWNKYFNLDKSIFKQKHYQFDYRISTDCFSVSIQLIHKSFVEKELEKKHKLKTKRNEIKNMTKEEKDNYKLNKGKNIMTKKINQPMKKGKNIEFPYLEELSNKKIEELKKQDWVVVDAGKRCLLYMKSKNGKTFRYTNKTHMKIIKRLKYQKLIKNYKEKHNISKIENELSKYNSKSCNYEKFKNFILNKNRINKILVKKYQNDIFRKYKWYSFINNKRSHSELVNKIKKNFGNNTTLIYGDWSIGKQMRNFISTPNLGLKRNLSNYFTIYSIDEFRTSLLHYKTEQKCENLYLPDKKEILRKIHSILTFQTENKRMGCINRDENAVRNMIKLTKFFLEKKDRPNKYKREYKIKDDNPINDGVKCHHA